MELFEPIFKEWKQYSESKVAYLSDCTSAVF